jgi:hypothetical protein
MCPGHLIEAKGAWFQTKRGSRNLPVDLSFPESDSLKGIQSGVDAIKTMDPSDLEDPRPETFLFVKSQSKRIGSSRSLR